MQDLHRFDLLLLDAIVLTAGPARSEIREGAIGIAQGRTPGWICSRPSGNLVHTGHGRDVTMVLVDGEVLVEDGRPTRVDQDQICARAAARRSRLKASAAGSVGAAMPSSSRTHERRRALVHERRRDRAARSPPRLWWNTLVMRFVQLSVTAALAALFFHPAQAQPAPGSCEALRADIAENIEEAKNRNQTFRLRGLEKALREAKENCSDARRLEERMARIEQQEKKVAERQFELDLAREQGRPDKIARREAKLAGEQAALHRLLGPSQLSDASPGLDSKP